VGGPKFEIYARLEKKRVNRNQRRWKRRNFSPSGIEITYDAAKKTKILFFRMPPRRRRSSVDFGKAAKRGEKRVHKKGGYVPQAGLKLQEEGLRGKVRQGLDRANTEVTRQKKKKAPKRALEKCLNIRLGEGAFEENVVMAVARETMKKKRRSHEKDTLQRAKPEGSLSGNMKIPRKRGLEGEKTGVLHKNRSVSWQTREFQRKGLWKEKTLQIAWKGKC